MCDRWLNSFANFFADMGEAPSVKHTLDRKDVNGDYEPGNCRWATAREQANNTRANTHVMFRGRKFTIAELARHVGVDAGSLRQHLGVRKRPVEQAVAMSNKLMP